MSLKTNIKKLIPEKAISLYHLSLAVLAGLFYGWPTKKMIVIGITGTKGKTSTANFIWSVLTAAGCKTGLIGTANIRIGEKEILNKYHMTMPGRFALQRFLKKMLNAGCEYCVVETTSQGIKQWRHYGIFYDVAIFTNLSPEHLEAHGSFENYRKAKGELFNSLGKSGQKILHGKKIDKIIIANGDDARADYYLSFPADRKITYGTEKGEFRAENIRDTEFGVEFFVGKEKYEIDIFGKFNVYNALPVIVLGHIWNIPQEIIYRGLKSMKSIPGRMEKIDEGQKFLVLVDYAHEKQSMSLALDTARNLVDAADGRVIVVFGSEGGGRDKAKRIDLGEITAKKADFLVVTSTDPYEEDPQEICEIIARTAEKFGKVRGENLFPIADRREGIKKAISMARENDVILIAGKGSEQSMIVGEKHVPWDDRKIVREEINKILK